MREAEDDAEHSRKGGLNAPQEAVILDSTCPGGDIGELPHVDNPVRSPQRSEGWYNAPYAPPFDLFPRGLEESKKWESSSQCPNTEICVDKPVDKGLPQPYFIAAPPYFT
jgi:hypothetical protein